LNKKECPLARNYRFEKFSTEQVCREKEEELLRAYKEKHGKLPIYARAQLVLEFLVDLVCLSTEGSLARTNITSLMLKPLRYIRYREQELV
jgi:hypothetical protein